MIDYIKMTDEALQQLSRDGDHGAETLLVEKYSRLVRACARPYFLAGGDSEDLFQEGMLGFLSALREYSPDGGASFRTYAELCVRRRLYTAIKTASGAKNAPLNDYVSFESPFFDGGTESAEALAGEACRREPEELLIDKERSAEILKEFSARLSTLEAEILGLYLKGLSYREIGQKLDRTPKSVDNAVQRVRKKLAHHLNLGDISI